MGRQTLLVACDEADRQGVDRAFGSGLEATVTVLTALDELVSELCYEPVHCLLVAPEVDGVAGDAVARAVRSLYPDLPIVVAGTSADATDADVTTASEALDDEAVVAAVRSELAGDARTAAARPPSRLETLAVSMFEGFPDHLYAKDGDARHVFTSNTMIPTSGAMGRTDFEVEGGPNDEHAEKTVADDWRVLEDGDPVLEVEEYVNDDGAYSLTSKVPWYDADGEVTGLVGITRDISRRKDREQELRQQNERLAKVALVAAHELRNELQVATGRLDLLGEKPDQADVVGESLDRLVSVVDDVVALTTQERRVLDRTEVWISTPAHAVWESLETGTGPGGGTPTPTGSATLEVTDDRRIVADMEAVRLLFDILLSNAVEHGGPDVTVTVGATDEGFYVADDGPGIDVDPPERVFDAGFADSDELPGFGLYVAQRIANDHGWGLDASNRPAGGARFDVRGMDEDETG